LFTEITPPISSRESENTTNDFKRQPLMVNPISFSGASLTKGDVNGDGLEDIYVGGHDGEAGTLYLLQKDGKFIKKPNPAFDADKAEYRCCRDFL
jgi:hypothetical protein